MKGEKFTSREKQGVSDGLFERNVPILIQKKNRPALLVFSNAGRFFVSLSRYVRDARLTLSRRCTRRRWSASCGLWRGGLPIRGDRQRWPFFHGNRACFFSFCSRVGMFFSSLYLFYVIILPVSGCKSREFLRNNQVDNSFSLKSFAFFVDLH